MDVDQSSRPTEPDGIGKRLSDAWNSRNRIATLILLTATALFLNCCCVIIPLWE